MSKKRPRKMRQHEANGDAFMALFEGLIVRPLSWLLCRLTGEFCNWQAMHDEDGES